MMLINPYRFGSPLLLDTYTGAAAAYSLRKLRTAYTGYCIEVRRSSDDTTQNIGFTSAGVLDESALTTFVGAGNDGFVKTWYDQAGSNNAVQTTNTTQPQIVASGTILTVNSKPAVKFIKKELLHSMNISGGSTLHSIFCISSPITLTLYSMPFAQGDNANTINGISLFLNVADSKWGTYSNNGKKANTTLSNGVQYLLGMIRNGSGDGTFYINGGTDGTYPSTSGSTRKSIGHSTYANEYTQEVIFYNSNQSANISGIRTNINSFYSIY